jgi:hypothetical protein
MFVKKFLLALTFAGAVVATSQPASAHYRHHRLVCQPVWQQDVLVTTDSRGRVLGVTRLRTGRWIEACR